MIKSLLKAILIVLCLIILIPLVMLLIGEGALVGKIFHISLPEKHEQTEMITRSDGSSAAWTKDQDGNISIVQSVNGSSSSQNATFNFLGLEIPPETVTSDGEKGMNMVVSFSTENMINANLYCMIRFYDASGEPLKSHSSSKYRSQNGNVFTGDWCVPTSNSQTSNITLFLPYSELPQTKGATEYLLDVSFLKYSSNTEFDVLYRSEPSSFTYTAK